MAAAIEAADAALKSANVTLIGIELTKGDGMVLVKLEGDVGAVKAAVESAKHAASLVNKVYATKVIPRPAEGIDKIVFSKETRLASKVAQVAPEGRFSECSPHSENLETQETPEETQEEVILVAEESFEAPVEAIEGATEEKALAELSLSGSISGSEEPPLLGSFPDPSRPGICNYCQDPECPRRKGDPRDWCKMHHQDKN